MIFYSIFSIFIANIRMHFNLFRFFWTYFNIILSFFLYSFWENKFVYSSKLLWNHEINNPNTKVFTHFWIKCLYSINICYNIFVSNEFSNFFWNMFNSKTIKVCYIFSIHIKSNPMNSFWFILIKIYFICHVLILYKLFLE